MKKSAVYYEPTHYFPYDTVILVRRMILCTSPIHFINIARRYWSWRVVCKLDESHMTFLETTKPVVVYFNNLRCLCVRPKLKLQWASWQKGEQPCCNDKTKIHRHSLFQNQNHPFVDASGIMGFKIAPSEFYGSLLALPYHRDHNRKQCDNLIHL